jgi:hypothetical protein
MILAVFHSCFDAMMTGDIMSTVKVSIGVRQQKLQLDKRLGVRRSNDALLY